MLGWINRCKAYAFLLSIATRAEIQSVPDMSTNKFIHDTISGDPNNWKAKNQENY